jgi:flavin reductase (DIM6/NTAB) family NADH-FMN oxidoreductase RutF
VYNMVTYDLREAMNKTAEGVPPQVDEFELAGLTKALSVLVKPFRVAESPVQMECSFYTSLHLPGRGKEGSVDVLIGKVLAVHIADDVLTKDGKLDVVKIKPLARLGYADYTTVEHSFEMLPVGKHDAIYGLSGASILHSRDE